MFWTPVPKAYNWLPLIASVELAVTDPAATLLSLVAVVVEPFAFWTEVIMFAAATSLGLPIRLPSALTSVAAYHLPSAALVTLSPAASVYTTAALLLAFARLLSSWPLFTASLAVVALPTLVILLPPALIPSVLVMLGPPVMLKPLLFNVLSPAVTLVTSRLSASSIAIEPVWSVTVLTFLPL